MRAHQQASASRHPPGDGMGDGIDVRRGSSAPARRRAAASPRGGAVRPPRGCRGRCRCARRFFVARASASCQLHIDLDDTRQRAGRRPQPSPLNEPEQLGDVVGVGAPRRPRGVLALEIQTVLREVLERSAAQVDRRRERVADGRAPAAWPAYDPPLLPGRTSISPTASSTRRASRNVGRPTPNSSQSCAPRKASGRSGSVRNRSPRATDRRHRRTNERAAPCRNPTPSSHQSSHFLLPESHLVLTMVLPYIPRQGRSDPRLYDLLLRNLLTAAFRC